MSHRILVVDDDSDTRLLNKCALELQNYNVDLAASCDEALLFLAEHTPPDVILLDLSMPGLSGTDFIQKLQQNPRWETISVIIISGWDNLEQRAREMGAQGFIRKPFGLDFLYDRVAQVLQVSDGRREQNSGQVFRT